MLRVESDFTLCYKNFKRVYYIQVYHKVSLQFQAFSYKYKCTCECECMKNSKILEVYDEGYFGSIYKPLYAHYLLHEER